MSKEEIVLVDGMFFKKINDDFFAISFSVEKFKDFMDAYKKDKGYCNINVLKSKTGKYYGKLNVYEPKKKEQEEF